MAEVTSRIIEVCPFRIKGDRGEYLLIRRAPDDPLYPGLWQFVSGRVEEGEKAHEAALRELREEAGDRPCSSGSRVVRRHALGTWFTGLLSHVLLRESIGAMP